MAQVITPTSKTTYLDGVESYSISAILSREEEEDEIIRRLKGNDDSFTLEMWIKYA
jgi:hypothetical protein